MANNDEENGSLGSFDMDSQDKTDKVIHILGQASSKGEQKKSGPLISGKKQRTTKIKPSKSPLKPS